MNLLAQWFNNLKFNRGAKKVSQVAKEIQDQNPELSKLLENQVKLAKEIKDDLKKITKEQDK